MRSEVCLRVEGLMLERLLQRALSEGARFSRVTRPDPRTLIVTCDPRSAVLLTGLCERFSLKCEELSRRGTDAILRRLKQRITLLAGILTCLATVSLFLSRVWLIDVELTGERSASVRPIEESLEQMGIRPGMARSDVDPALLEDALAASAPDFSFVGVRLEGVRLLVEASPAVPAPELYEIERAGDLVAACDGVVVSVNVLAGEAMVQPGDTVARGQVLIRGLERTAPEESREIAALGSVVARTWYEGTASLPTTRAETTRTGRSSTSARLSLMNWSWPLVEGETYASQEEQTEILPVGGLYLPLEIVRTTAHETQTRRVPNDEAALRETLAALAFADAGARLSQAAGDCEIADQWIEYTRDGADRLCARAVYEAHTDIAVTRDALYQQGG